MYVESKARPRLRQVNPQDLTINSYLLINQLQKTLQLVEKNIFIPKERKKRLIDEDQKRILCTKLVLCVLRASNKARICKAGMQTLRDRGRAQGEARRGLKSQPRVQQADFQR